MFAAASSSSSGEIQSNRTSIRSAQGPAAVIFAMGSSAVFAQTETQILPLFTCRILKVDDDTSRRNKASDSAKGGGQDHSCIATLLNRYCRNGPGDRKA